MFDHTHYVPILKCKQGEFKALHETSAELKAGFTPLFELPPIPTNFEENIPAKSATQHINGLTQKISDSWGTQRLAFMDFVHLDSDLRMDDGSHPFSSFLTDAYSVGLNMIPVTGLRRDDAYQAAVINALSLRRLGVCIRLETADIASLRRTLPAFTELQGRLGIQLKEIDLVIDMKEVTDQGVAVMIARNALNLLPFIADLRTVTISGSAMPQSMSAFISSSTSITPRIEWEAYLDLLANPEEITRIPTFSDYTIVHPDPFEMDWRMMKLGAKIKYTANRYWVIVKGVSVEKAGWAQTQTLCQALVSQREYRGPHFSWGDKYIIDRANASVGPGNATTWVSVGVNHHLAFVVDQTSSLSVT